MKVTTGICTPCLPLQQYSITVLYNCIAYGGEAAIEHCLNVTCAISDIPDVFVGKSDDYTTGRIIWERTLAVFGMRQTSSLFIEDIVAFT